MSQDSDCTSVASGSSEGHGEGNDHDSNARDNNDDHNAESPNGNSSANARDNDDDHVRDELDDPDDVRFVSTSSTELRHDAVDSQVMSPTPETFGAVDTEPLRKKTIMGQILEKQKNLEKENKRLKMMMQEMIEARYAEEEASYDDEMREERRRDGVRTSSSMETSSPKSPKSRKVSSKVSSSRDVSSKASSSRDVGQKASSPKDVSSKASSSRDVGLKVLSPKDAGLI